MSQNDLFVNPCLIVRVRYAPSADSAHSENRIKNEELEGVLAQYPSIQKNNNGMNLANNILSTYFLSDHRHPCHALCRLWLPDDLLEELRLLRHLLHRHDHRHHHRVRHPLLWDKQI